MTYYNTVMLKDEETDEARETETETERELTPIKTLLLILSL